MDQSEIKKHIEFLEFANFIFKPYEMIKSFIKTTNDIVEYRNILKSGSLDDQSIIYLVDFIVNNLENNVRFKRVECIKILKRLVKNRRTEGYFPKELSKKLFYLYKHFIFKGSEEVQWAVSVFIKDQILDDDEIKWLIENYLESDHLVNRLLRYPEYNQLITEWAKEIYLSGNCPDRLSEVIALTIQYDLPEYVSEKSNVISWAIYYSKCSIEKKEELLVKYLDYENYHSALECAERLNIPSIVGLVIDHYKSMLQSDDFI
jgi:hypothetical protein